MFRKSRYSFILLIAVTLQVVCQGQNSTADLLERLRQAQQEKLRANAQGWMSSENLAKLEARDLYLGPDSAPVFQTYFQFPGKLEIDEKSVLDKIAEDISKAEREILINSYLLSYEPILVALINSRYINGTDVIAILEPLPPAKRYTTPQILISNNVFTFFCNAKGYNYNNYVIIDRKKVYTGFPLTQSLPNHAVTGHILEGSAVIPFTDHFIRHLNQSINPETQQVQRSEEDIPKAVQDILFNF